MFERKSIANDSTGTDDATRPTFDDLHPGYRFAPTSATFSATDVTAYVAATGDDRELYARVLPAGMSLVLARLGYLVALPAGAVMLRQSISWLAPAVVGTPIDVESVVREREAASRRSITFETTLRQGGAAVARLSVKVGWPEPEPT
jgi:hypothetical protein